MHRSHALRYSGFSCWRGLTESCPEEVLKHGPRMLKTIIHPAREDVSVTAGFTTDNRCFWVLDVIYPQVREWKAAVRGRDAPWLSTNAGDFAAFLSEGGGMEKMAKLMFCLGWGL